MSSEISSLELQYQEASTKALQDAMLKRDQEDLRKDQLAKAEAQRQQKIVDQTKARLNEVSKFVKNVCISYGALRLHDSIIYGKQPSELPLPSGKSDDDCSRTSARQLMAVVLSNYGKAKQNISQLNGLIEFYQPKAQK